MSMNWKYITNISNSEENNIIDTIYCSHIEMTIPIVYFWTVLLKDGTEYDLMDPKLNELLTNDIDIDAYNKAKDNYINL
jgi:hypothetical protein